MEQLNPKESANLLLSIFIIFTLSLCSGGYVLYRHQERTITKEKYIELAAINKLKVDQIEHWRKEHLDHARNIFYNQAVINHILEYIHGVDQDENYQTITSWVKTILYEPDYSLVFLIDPSGKIILNSNPGEPITEMGKHIIEQAKRRKNIIFSDLLNNNDKNIFIDLAIPLYLKPDTREGFSGVALIRIDPKKFLYPLILNWPTPSRSSETMLIRRQGDSVLFLSELLYKKNTALRFRLPMTNNHLLAVQAIYGKTGIIEGVDYRGIRVLGDAHPVHGSPWFVITKVDIAEIYQPILGLALWILIITLLLILITALIIYLIWTRQLNKSERERNMAVEKLNASEEGFKTLADSIPQFVWIARADGMVSYVNQRWVEYSGLSLDESYGTGWVKPLHPDDKQPTMDAWKYAIESGIKYDVVCRIRKYDGVFHWFVIKAEALRDSSGAIIKWYGTCTGIDIQKQTELEIQKLNEELEAFSYSVSHDLRAPLINIDGLSLILIETCYDQLNDKGRQYLDHLRKETLRMRNLIDALLSLSRVSHAKLNNVHVDLTILAQDITKRLLNDSTDRQVEINIQPKMVTYGDPELLEIVLTNLLNNAYKFTSKQPLAQIEFGQSMIDDKPTFWVRDNGAGFDMANANNLFGAFQRLHKQSDFPGTGIGLATVQRIIHRHDGRIWAESKIDQGATFYFTLSI